MNRLFAVSKSRLAGIMAGVFMLSASMAAAQQPAGQVRSIRNLGGPTRFTAPVRSVAALRTSMSRPAIQRDIATVLDRAGLAPLTMQVQNILAQGQVMQTTLPTGTAI